jgi:hypothetical protein
MELSHKFPLLIILLPWGRMAIGYRTAAEQFFILVQLSPQNYLQLSGSFFVGAPHVI